MSVCYFDAEYANGADNLFPAILSIGLVIKSKKKKYEYEYYFKVPKNIIIDKGIQKLTGISFEVLEEKHALNFNETFNKIFELLERHRVTKIYYYDIFDKIAMLSNFRYHRTSHYKERFINKMVDLAPKFQKIIGSSISISNLYYIISGEFPKNVHNALVDARVLYKINTSNFYRYRMRQFRCFNSIREAYNRIKYSKLKELLLIMLKNDDKFFSFEDYIELIGRTNNV